jgi:hypothetical protein
MSGHRSHIRWLEKTAIRNWHFDQSQSRVFCFLIKCAIDRSWEIKMEQILINLIAGALGGAATGKSSPTFDLGTVGNIISGLVGGGVLGQIVTLALPSIMAAAQSGNLSIGGVISQLVAGGAGGAILTAIIGAIKNKAMA